MIDLTLASITLLTVLLFLILLLGFLDFRKKRILKERPFVSFMIPCYNNEKTIEETIESIYSSYDASRFEIIVVNDCSTDSSLTVLQRIRKKRKFMLINNETNRGKSASLNANVKRAKSDILFIVDGDIVLNREAVEDVLARLQEERVAAVCSQFLSKNRGFLPLMQTMEYYMLTFIQCAHNGLSTMGLCGASFGVKRKAFEEVGLLSENAISEDMDLALKLREAGYRVQQTFYCVESYVPDTVRWWFHQKIRWLSGSTQNVIKHFFTWLKSPLTILFLFLFSCLSVVTVAAIARQVVLFGSIFDTYELLTQTTSQLLSFRLIGLYYGAILLKNLLATLSFSAFSLLYAIPMIRRPVEIYKLVYAIPFALLYLPVYSVISIIGLFVGVARYPALARGERAW
jgi:biofilm PGA synthesis N-glycosyltransferase PgaC